MAVLAVKYMESVSIYKKEVTDRMATSLVLSFTVDGIHFWPNAPERYKEFGQPHRHLFKVICVVPMPDSSDPDRRQKELWELRSETIDMVYEMFASEGCVKESVIDFGGMSVEGIADAIRIGMGERLGVWPSQIFVGEDWFLGAIVS